MQSRQEENPPVSLTFDDQANDFDRRAGLPREASRWVARAVSEIAAEVPGPLLDLGAGTGEIGVFLAQSMRPYLALDASLPMLTAFRQKLLSSTVQEVPGTTSPTIPEVPGTTSPTIPEVPGTTSPTIPEVPGTTSPTIPEVPGTASKRITLEVPGTTLEGTSSEVPGTTKLPVLLLADADRRWPLADDSVTLMFSSRAIHLLRLPHVVEEVQRIRRSDGAILVLGSVQRRKDSLRHALRGEMRRLLASHGWQGRSGRRARTTLFERLTAHGWTGGSSRTVVSWPVQECPRDSLEAWRRKEGLAGWTLPADLRHRILDRLEAWAIERYGDLDSLHATHESYHLEVIHSSEGSLRAP